MPFKPTIQLLGVAPGAANFTIKDTTTAGTIGGYGDIGAPADFAAVVAIRTQTQHFGQDIILHSSSLHTGTLDTGLTVSYYLQDGVVVITALYGVLPEIPPVVDVVQWELDASDPNIMKYMGTLPFEATFAGASYVAAQEFPEALQRIRAINVSTSTVEFYEPIKPTFIAVDGTETYKNNFVFYFPAPLVTLVFNSSDGGIVNDIGNMALVHCGCDPETSGALLDRVLLKLAAQTAFACGNYAKAAQAIALLTGSSPVKPCSTC